jgi:hypothetical protein
MPGGRRERIVPAVRLSHESDFAVRRPNIFGCQRRMPPMCCGLARPEAIRATASSGRLYGERREVVQARRDRPEERSLGSGYMSLVERDAAQQRARPKPESRSSLRPDTSRERDALGADCAPFCG